MAGRAAGTHNRSPGIHVDVKPEEAAGRVADEALRLSRTPVIVAIAGPVAVGKSTFAELVRAELAHRSINVEVLCTDCFLLPNAELARRGLAMRKGFPGTYDDDALVAAIDAVKRGGVAKVPVYSHSTYDIIAGEVREIGPVDALVVEGLNALQSRIITTIDLAVYLEADDQDLRDWFLDRFAAMCESAVPGDFYAQFASMTQDQQLTIADAAWSGINLINNRDHIVPSKANAQLLIQKGRDHLVRSIGEIP